jgi:hypothetical protein
LAFVFCGDFLFCFVVSKSQGKLFTFQGKSTQISQSERIMLPFFLYREVLFWYVTYTIIIFPKP